MIILTFQIATLSGPRHWMPASSDNFASDTSRSNPLMIKQVRKELMEISATIEPAIA